MSDLFSLPRVWWFPPIGPLQRAGEDGGTYWAYPLNDQPDVTGEADAGLGWLDNQPDASGIGGFAIGLNLEELERYEDRFSIRRIQYGSDALSLLRERLIEIVNVVLATRLPNMSLADDLSEQLFVTTYELLGELKAEPFREERETRLIADEGRATPDSVQFRRSGSMLVPYVELDLRGPDGLLPLDEVVVGPNPHQSLAVQAVRRLLLGKGYPTGRVWPSQVPLRA